MIDRALLLLRATDAISRCICLQCCHQWDAIYHSADIGPLSQWDFIWRSNPGWQSPSGPGINGPACTITTSSYHIAGAPVVFRSCCFLTCACVRLEKPNRIVSNNCFAEHWHWLYEDHLCGLLCNYNWSPLFWSSCTAWITLAVSSTAGTGTINVSKRQLTRAFNVSSNPFPSRYHSPIHTTYSVGSLCQN